MEELMFRGWQFELYKNKLDTYTAIAGKKIDGILKTITVDEFSWWPLIVAIVAAVDKFEKDNAIVQMKSGRKG